MKTEVEQKQIKRSQLLNAVYKQADGSTSEPVHIDEVIASFNGKNDDFKDAIEDLPYKNSIRRLGAGSPIFLLTPKGKNAVENKLFPL